MENVCESSQVHQDHDGRGVVVSDHDHVDAHDFIGIRKGLELRLG